MKKLIILFVALIPLVSGCKKDQTPGTLSEIREIAWNSLSTVDQSTVIGDWKEATVTETTYNEKSAYAVTFHTTQDALLGPITVYVDQSTKLVLGYDLRD